MKNASLHFRKPCSLINTTRGYLPAQRTFNRQSSFLQPFEFADSAPDIKLILGFQSGPYSRNCILKVELGRLKPIPQVGECIFMGVHVRYPLAIGTCEFIGAPTKRASNAQSH